MKKGIGYIRVSTEMQEDKFGKDSQKTMILEYAEKNDIEIIDFVEDTISGAKESREGLNHLLYDNVECDCIVVAKSDRIARDVMLYYVFVHTLEVKGIKVLSASESFDNTPMGKMLLAFVVCMAEQERINITERTSRGRKEAWKKGKHGSGVAPYGYITNKGELYLYEEEAVIVRQIFDLWEQNIEPKEIVKVLRLRGVLRRNGTPFDQAGVLNILNKWLFYRGFNRFNEGKKGEWQPILDERYKKKPPKEV